MIDNTVLKEYIIDQNKIIIGRDGNCDICIDNITVSRKHARITREPVDYWVEDMGSINGTFVNGHWVSKKLLDTGDEISIGKYSIVIYFEDNPSMVTATAAAKNRPIDEGCSTSRIDLNDFENILKKRSK
jgi:pSer/pThr/pTyr-binding forkhead associated (FHA) protein